MGGTGSYLRLWKFFPWIEALINFPHVFYAAPVSQLISVSFGCFIMCCFYSFRAFSSLCLMLELMIEQKVHNTIVKNQLKLSPSLLVGRTARDVGAPGVLVRITSEGTKYLPLSKHSNVRVFPICEFHVWPHLQSIRSFSTRNVFASLMPCT